MATAGQGFYVGVERIFPGSAMKNVLAKVVRPFRHQDGVLGKMQLCVRQSPPR
jgi:hypothetical protein